MATKSSMMVTTATLSDYMLLAPPDAYGTYGGCTMYAATSIRARRFFMAPFATGTAATRRLRFGASVSRSAPDVFRGCTFFAPPFEAGFFPIVASRSLISFSPGCVFLGAFASRLLRQ